jgi:N-acyl-D-aspartate/D-glutamate deacylase
MVSITSRLKCYRPPRKKFRALRFKSSGYQWRGVVGRVWRNEPVVDSARKKNMQENSFAAIIDTEIREPLQALCDLFAEEAAMSEFAYFANLLFMLNDPEDEVQVLATVIELSNCAFVGLSYSDEALAQIDSLLARAIDVAHTMSAPAHLN